MWARRQTRAETEMISVFQLWGNKSICVSAHSDSPSLWMSSGVSAALFSWLALQFEVLPFRLPCAQMGRCAAFGSGCSVKARQGCILQERLLNQALTIELRGRGRGDGCGEAGSRNGGSEGGTKERQGRENADSYQCWGWRGEWRRIHVCISGERSLAYSIILTRCAWACKRDKDWWEERKQIVMWWEIGPIMNI